MTTHHCVVRIHTERDHRSVTKVIAHQAGQYLTLPVLAWAEPDPLHVELSNHSGRRADFLPLMRGIPCWPDDLPLVEARLFWDTAALHVVADESGGCAWTRIEELDGIQDVEGIQLMRSTMRIHTRRDMARFGLSNLSELSGLQAIKYLDGGRLVAWRLMFKAGESYHG